MPSSHRDIGASNERSRIVSWLRDRAEATDAAVLDEIAEEIEAGEHLKERP